ncbi:unnamed protein product, partial [marine sediment metagenome]
KSKRCSEKSIIYSVIIWMAIDLVIILSGFTALQLFPNLTDPDMAFIMLGVAIFPNALRGIFFIALLAMIMSTVDSFLQSGAASLTHDVYRHFKPKSTEKQLIMASRIFIIILGLLSLTVALYFQMIIPALVFTLTIWTAAMLVPTLLALTGRKIRNDTAFYCLLGGALSALIGGKGNITEEGILFGFFITTRLLTMILILPLVSMTTPIDRLTLGLVRLGLPYQLAYITTTALNQVAVLKAEAGVIMDA